VLILTLRTDNPQAEVGLYVGNQRLAYETWEAHRQLAETLHRKIQQLLDEQHKKWSDIAGVVIFQGPGSFTGLRIGISVANAIGNSFDIPVYGAQGDDWIRSGLKHIKEEPSRESVIPFYGSDANITTPRK
jgi:tRNA threonylcarbamoyladenosine biosynthesis protein TsaB